MALKKEYFDLLDHIGKTSTISSLHQSTEGDHVVALRHDVDHDLDLALEMAHHEWRLGYRATYYLLHTEDYWNDPDFALKVKQLSEYGHEIGLHVNSFSSWYMNLCNDPNLEIEQALARLRSCGIEVKGVCAHGDKLCYQHQFVNYWMWKELRGENPEITEEGISAEGIHVEGKEHQISYPKSHSLRRGDGSSIQLWNMSTEEHGIEYDAAHLSCEYYWTDSGGNWKRSENPLEHDFTSGRHQVLVHPWWWRGETTSIFILSPVTNEVDLITNCLRLSSSSKVLKDWTLNHFRVDDKYIRDDWGKIPKAQFHVNKSDENEICRRIKASLAFKRIQKRDIIELNTIINKRVLLSNEILNSHVAHLQTPSSRPKWLSIVKGGAIDSKPPPEQPIKDIIDIRQLLSDQDYFVETFSGWGMVVHPFLLRVAIERNCSDKNSGA